MAKRKKEEGSANTNEWLNTYADMVTLVLCFFVLLYAASVPDEAKWQWIMQAFQNNGDYFNRIVQEPKKQEPESVGDMGTDIPPTMDEDSEDISVPGALPMNFDQLYNWVEEVSEASNLNESISVAMENGRLHIRFDEDIMFEPNSAVLTDRGRQALNLFHPGIHAIDKYIKSMQVEGHTAMTAYVNMFDWELSSDRAVSVTQYLDGWKKTVESDKFHTQGYGPYQPLYPNDSPEHMAKNRRVELVITRNDYEPENTNIISDVLKYDYGFMPLPGGADDPKNPVGNHDVNAISTILKTIGGLYPQDDPFSEQNIPQIGPSIPGMVTITEDMLKPVTEEEGETSDSSAEETSG